jgi:hypothetical protein
MMLTELSTFSGSIAIVVLIVGGLLAALYYMFRPDIIDTPGMKVLGTIFVTALALASNSSWTYGIAIFILAALITELDFLEKLAAMVWGRDKYWDYLVRRAGDEEKKAKDESEAKQVLSTETSPKIPLSNREMMELGSLFENEVANALTPLFAPGHLIRNAAIQNGYNAVSVVDFLGEGPDSDCIFECMPTSKVRLSVIRQVAMYKRAYEAVFVRRGKLHGVQVALVLLATDQETPSMVEGVPVFTFDRTKRRFVDETRLHKWISGDGE